MTERPLSPAGHQMPTVAIVTPSFNQRRWLGETIESILAQDYPNIDYLVVDAGSTDGSLDLLRSYGDRVHWFCESDSGQAEGVDKGIKRTTGEIIGWLNADDVYEPGAVRRAVEALQAAPDAPAVYGNATYIDADSRFIRPCSHVEPWNLDRLIGELDFIVQPASFFRRSAYEAVGGLDWDLHYSLDYDLFIRLGKLAPLVYLPERQARVRMYEATKTSSGGMKRLEELERMIRRHGRKHLPADFQREMVIAARSELKRGIRHGHPRSVLRGAFRLAQYWPRVLLHPPQPREESR
jgi:glycosyltransferase involved in cell wall biosynthesis